MDKKKVKLRFYLRATYRQIWLTKKKSIHQRPAGKNFIQSKAVETLNYSIKKKNHLISFVTSPFGNKLDNAIDQLNVLILSKNKKKTPSTAIQIKFP